MFNTKINGTVFGVLDIETSTEYINHKPAAVWLSYAVIALYDVRTKNKIKKYRFRHWKELEDVLEKIEKIFPKKKTLIYVHNLSFDIDFIYKNISKPSKIIANSTHGIISSILEKYKQIEFRCSYKLTMQPLRKIGESLGFPKLDSEYRYIKPDDEVTDEEWKYCERDCDIVAKYITNVILPEYKLLRLVPLTKTGRVRIKFKEHYETLGDTPEWDLLPPEDCYQAMLDAFAGGIVIANPLFAGRVITGVDSYDIKSSYPFVMLSEQYPYTIEKEQNPTTEMLKEKFWIAKLKFKKIRSKFAWGWLSESKMNYFDKITYESFNGKLLYCEEIIRTITNIDYELICKTYSFEEMEIVEFYHLEKYDDLPYPYIETIKDFAVKKHKLSLEVKELDENDSNYLEKNIEYMLSKNDFNGIYGMSVQKLVQEDYWLDDNCQYRATEKKYKQSNKHIKRNFLFGVYICAYARRNLLNCALQNNPETLLYTDTDSLKMVLTKPFVSTNKSVPEEYKDNPALCKLGTFEHDNHYDKFLYWGAKKYGYAKNGNLHLTVAGLPKIKEGNYKYRRGESDDLKELTKIEDFRPNMLFPDCKLAKRYIYKDYYFDSDTGFTVENDENSDAGLQFLRDNNIESNGGVALYRVGYELSVTKSDRRVIEACQRDLENILKAPTLQNIALSVSKDSLLHID